MCRLVGLCNIGEVSKRMNVFFYKQKTAYEVRISDWSSDVCSSDRDLRARLELAVQVGQVGAGGHQVEVLEGSAMREVRHRQGRELVAQAQIGTASCSERECQYV